MSLTPRHLALAASAVTAAALAATCTLPAAADRTAQAHRISAQADAAAHLPPADKKAKSALDALRAQLPANLTTDQAASAVDELATGHQLTWTTLTTHPPVSQPARTAYGDLHLTTVEVTATVTGDTDRVRALVADLAKAAPLMSVQQLQLKPDGTNSTAALTVLVHGTQEPR